jgi:uncharacterized repeat protein (TIGR03803 family)
MRLDKPCTSTPRSKHSTVISAMVAFAFGFLVTAKPLYAASSEQVLYAFQGGKHDGSEPMADLIFDSSGNLYGTTYTGGTYKGGTVFELTQNNGQWTESVLHIFQDKYGSAPKAGLAIDNAGNLYGTLPSGGTHNGGAVFELIPSGGEWTFRILHAFINNGKDGLGPEGRLIFDESGNLYGTSIGGGTHGGGTVFELKSSNGRWTEKVLYSFCSHKNCRDGAEPVAGLVFDKQGNLYSTTSLGGTHNDGTVFELVSDNDNWREKVLHSFDHNGYDGYHLLAGVILDTAGNLYGTTFYGGADSSCEDFSGCGIVFELTPNRNEIWTEKLLYSFHGRVDGSNPRGALVLDTGGYLLGTTQTGGTDNAGTVFALSPDNGKWTLNVLYAFGGQSDGGYPNAGITLDKGGNLYGTGAGGGHYGNGVFFEIIR